MYYTYVCICTHNTIYTQICIHVYALYIYSTAYGLCIIYTYIYMYTLVLYMYKTNHAYIYLSLSIYDYVLYPIKCVKSPYICYNIHICVYKIHTIHQLYCIYKYIGLCRWHSPDKNMSAKAEVTRDASSIPGRKIPWNRKWQPTTVFLPGKFYGQRNLVGYSPWSRK